MPRTGSRCWSRARRRGPIPTQWAATSATAATTPSSSKTARARSSCSTPSSWIRRSTSPPGATAATSCGRARPPTADARGCPRGPRTSRAATPPMTACSCRTAPSSLPPLPARSKTATSARCASTSPMTTAKPGKRGRCSPPQTATSSASPRCACGPAGSSACSRAPVRVRRAGATACARWCPTRRKAATAALPGPTPNPPPFSTTNPRSMCSAGMTTPSSWLTTTHPWPTGMSAAP